MVRIANQLRPGELLDRIVDHIVSTGLADLSLRPLAKAVNSSPRVLLYYFGSKEELVQKILARVRENQRKAFAELKSLNFENPSAACRAVWRHMRAPESEPFFRLFFEAYAMAVARPDRFAAFLKHAVEDWLQFLADPQIRSGRPRAGARAFATVVLAGFRGFLLDHCATHDRKRLDRAVEMWLQSLDAISVKISPKVSHRNSTRRNYDG